MLTTETIWNEFSDYLRNFIFGKIQHKEDTEDLLQEVFIKIHKYNGSLEDDTKLQSWIFAICRNVINDYWKKQKPTEIDLIEEKDEDEFNTMDLEKCLAPMIKNLPEKYSEVMLLSELDEVKQKEIAIQLNMSYSGVKSSIQRGRKLLKASFAACCNIKINGVGQWVEEPIMRHCSNCD